MPELKSSASNEFISISENPLLNPFLVGNELLGKDTLYTFDDQSDGGFQLRLFKINAYFQLCSESVFSPNETLLQQIPGPNPSLMRHTENSSFR